MLCHRPLSLLFGLLVAAATLQNQSLHIEAQELDLSLSDIPIPMPADVRPTTTVPVPRVPQSIMYDRPIHVVDESGLAIPLNTSQVAVDADEDVDVVDYNPWREHRHTRNQRPRRYFEADFLLWWAGDSTLPSLLTSNPDGTSIADAGLLGSTTTSTIYGNETVGNWPHPGIRLRAGRYLQDSMFSRAELSVWHLFEGEDNFLASSVDGSPILGRPFFDPSIGDHNSQLISFPGIVDGSFDSRYTRQALGVDPLLFFCLKSDRCRWWEFYTGYRFLWLRDSITMNESLQLTPGGFVAPGSRFDIEDSFEAGNAYHMIPLGLSLSGNRGEWIWNIRGDIGLGFVHQMVEIHGSTNDFTNNELTGSYAAGLLALETNSGRHERSRFAWVPQLAASLKRQVNERTQMTVGYTLINLNKAVQAVDHIPTVIDSHNIPPVLPGASPDPTFAFRDRSLLLHGFNFGLAFMY